MRVCILTVGSRGDVQPYVALARSLERAGHRTAVCASPAYRSFIESYGVEYACVDTGDPQVLLRSPEGQAIFRSTRNPLALLQGLCRLLEPVLEKGYAEACQVSADADALLVAVPAGDDLIARVAWERVHAAGQGGGVLLLPTGLERTLVELGVVPRRTAAGVRALIGGARSQSAAPTGSKHALA